MLFNPKEAQLYILHLQLLCSEYQNNPNELYN